MVSPYPGVLLIYGSSSLELLGVEKMIECVNWEISAWHMCRTCLSYLQAHFTNLNVSSQQSLERSGIISVLYMGGRKSKETLHEVLEETLC